MHSSHNSLQKKMPFISARLQTTEQEWEGHTAMTFTLQRRSLLGTCRCSYVFNMRCKKFCVRLKSPDRPHLRGGRSLSGLPCQGSHVLTLLTDFCLLKFSRSSSRSCLLPVASSYPCANKTVAQRLCKPRFPGPISILRLLSEANNQTHTRRWTHPSR